MVMSKQLSLREAISVSWKLIIDNWLRLFGSTLVVVLLAVLCSAMVLLLSLSSPYSPLLVGCTVLIACVFVHVYFFKLCLKVVRKENASFANCLPDFKLMFNWLIASVIVHVAILTGDIFLVLPGLLVSIRWWTFYSFAIVDGDSPISAISKSQNVSKGWSWQIFFLLLLPGVFIIISPNLFVLAFPFFAVCIFMIFALIYNQKFPHVQNV
jgi:hypothetical protein